MEPHDQPLDPLDGPGGFAGVPDAPASAEDIQTIIEDLILTVEQAKSAALSASKAVVDRAEFTQALHRLRDALPEELRQARHMVRERAAFVAQANEQAQEIIGRAKAKGAEMVSETQIMSEAVEEANILVRNAETEASHIRLEAEDAVGGSLGELDELLTRLLTDVRRRRQEFHQPRDELED